MKLTRLAILTRRLHRLNVIIIAVLGTIQAVTGMVLKYPDLPVLSLFDLRSSSEIHNLNSTFFTVSFAVIAVTGLFLYLYPWLQQVTRKSRSSPPTVNQIN